MAVLTTALTACGRNDSAASAETPPAAVAAQAGPRATLQVTSQQRQHMAGFGTAVASDSRFDPLGQTEGLTAEQAKRIDTLLLRSGVRLVRVFGPGQAVGPQGVQVWTADDSRLRMMRRLKGQGVRFVFTGQGAPADMVEGEPIIGRLRQGAEKRWAAFLAECLEVAQRAGTPFEFAAVGNEIDNERDPGVSLTPEQAATVTAELAAEIGRRGLQVRLALGDTLNWRTTLDYAPAQAAALGSTRPAFVATHGYGNEDARPDLVRFARAQGLPVWMTEWVDACSQGECPDDPSIGLALRWAQQIHDDLSLGSASAWFMFRGVADSTHGADGAIIVRDITGAAERLTTTKRFPVMRQFTTAAPPGSRRLDTRLRPQRDVKVLAFSAPRRRSVVMTNTTSNEVRLRVVLGSRGGQLRGWRTSATEDFRSILRRTIGRSRVNIVLPPQSVTTLVLQRRG